MNKIFLIAIMLCMHNIVIAQKKLHDEDWVKILSGKVESYQAYHIKSVKLRNNGDIVSEINYNPEVRKVTAINRKDTVTYTFDTKNRLVKVNFPNNSYVLEYKKNDTKPFLMRVEAAEDSLYRIQTISYPYPQQPESSWFELVKKSKKTGEIVFTSSEKNVVNPVASDWSYHEVKTNRNFYRRYDNRAYASLNYLSEKEYTYDSTYLRVDGIRYSKYEQFKNDTLWRHVSVGDSVYNDHFKAGKLFKKQLVVSKDNLTNEYNYSPTTGELSESILRTYFNDKYGNRTLWKTERRDWKTGKIATNYPNKRNFKLRNNALVERKKWNWFQKKKILECGTRSYGVHAYERSARPLYIYDIGSTSVMADRSWLEDRIDTDNLDNEFENDDVKQSFIHGEMHSGPMNESAFSGIYATGKIPRTAHHELFRIASRWFRTEASIRNLTVEVNTQNNKKMQCQPIQFLAKIELPVDIFSYFQVEK